ncbi:hypothetical protein [Massilia sp. YIM B02769]|uniref:hypothetical protein n=1 Tax=Massilia sp. YIM B02769 TaxID=3050129 RepID=UPI0025B6F3F2|nr:hypothetical protein [Massilia sp. YIM B02769]
MPDLRRHGFKWCNAIASLSGIAWAYAAYRYDWLNIGGGEIAFKEFWIAASGVVPCMALAVWLAALVLVALQDRRRALPVVSRMLRMGATLAIMPTSLFVADWFFHIGFGVSPV